MSDRTNATKQYSRQLPKDRNLRASNQDRDAVADILRRQHTEGRIDTDEFAERYGHCIEAKTYAQLDELVADLPPEAEPALGVAAGAGGPGWGPAWAGKHAWSRGPRRSTWGARRVWRGPLLAWLVLVLVISILLGHPFFWLAIPLFFLLVVRPLVWCSSCRDGLASRHRQGPATYPY